MANPKMKRVPRRRDELSMHSEVGPDGRYCIVLSRGDAMRYLTYDQVLLHSTATVQAAVRAEHDAAVVKQLTRDLELPLEDAAMVLEELRNSRAPVDAQALQPLGLTPLVTVHGKPFLEVRIGGHLVGKWTPADARSHALACLELAAAVPLDNAYFDYLSQGQDPVESNVGRGAVADLGKYLAQHKVVQG